MYEQTVWGLAYLQLYVLTDSVVAGIPAAVCINRQCGSWHTCSCIYEQTVWGLAYLQLYL